MGRSNILITGASSGLGKAMAQKLEDDGHFVMKFDLRDGHDVRDSGSITRFRDRVSGISGVDIDVLINNAGVNIIDWLENFDEEQWDEVMNVNAKGIYLMSKEFLPSLMRTKHRQQCSSHAYDLLFGLQCFKRSSSHNDFANG